MSGTFNSHVSKEIFSKAVFSWGWVDGWRDSWKNNSKSSHTGLCVLDSLFQHKDSLAVFNNLRVSVCPLPSGWAWSSCLTHLFPSSYSRINLIQCVLFICESTYQITSFAEVRFFLQTSNPGSILLSYTRTVINVSTQTE